VRNHPVACKSNTLPSLAVLVVRQRQKISQTLGGWAGLYRVFVRNSREKEKQNSYAVGVGVAVAVAVAVAGGDSDGG
jgi:hypothetical protein